MSKDIGRVRVVQSATEPERCGTCHGRTFAHMDAPPAPVEGSSIEQRAKNIGHSRGDPNWWNFLDEARASLAASTAPVEGAVERAIEAAKRASFSAGYLIAVANLMHLHDEPTMAEDVLRELGQREGILKRLDLSDYDAKPLRKLFRNISRRARSTLANLRGSQT